MQGMVGREDGAQLEIGDDARADALGQRHALLPGLRRARAAARQHDRPLGAGQRGGGAADEIGIGRRAGSRRHARDVEGGERRGELRLLHAGVQVDVDRALRRRLRDPFGAHQRLARGCRRGRLVVPLGVAADERALVACGVDPIDPGTALVGVDRAGGADQQHRHAVAPGVEHGHGRVHQADVGMHRRRHRPARDLGPAVGDCHRVLLVQAKEHGGALVAEAIDEAVVQPAEAGSGIEGDVGDVERTQRVGGNIAAEAGLARQRGDRALQGRPGRRGGWAVVGLAHDGRAGSTRAGRVGRFASPRQRSMRAGRVGGFASPRMRWSGHRRFGRER